MTFAHTPTAKLVLVALVSLLVGSEAPVAIAQAPNDPSPSEAPFLRPPMECPADLSTVVAGLLRDLPSYANRVARRSVDRNADGSGFGTMLVAGRAELEPLALDPLTFGTAPIPDDEVRQVFFTTLERQYTTTDVVLLEHYYWLFMTPSETGWRMMFIFSRLAPAESQRRPPTPPAEVSDGIVGQAVRLWLRDCRAGAVYPIESDDRDSDSGEVRGR